MRAYICFTTVLLTAGLLVAGEPSVKLTVKKETVDVTVGGKPFAVYKFSKDLPKPYFYPARGRDGTILTRPILPDQKEHPHHKGIWVAVDEINEIKFWAEKGKIVNKSVKAVTAEGNPAKLKVVNHWLGVDGKPIVTESTVIGIHANGLLSYLISFKANRSMVTFGDTKEGLLGFRMVDSMRENEGGVVVNADGLKGTKECWGKPSDWVDYHGTVNGKTYGITIMDHPDNFRRSRYHVRNYGLFSISPFGEKAYTNGRNNSAPLHLTNGQTVRLRYGLYIHSGDTRSANVAGVYKQFAKTAK